MTMHEHGKTQLSKNEAFCLCMKSMFLKATFSEFYQIKNKIWLAIEGKVLKANGESSVL